MQLLLIFTALSIVNVVFSTTKSIATVKSSRLVASLVNATYYSYYNIILIITIQDFPLWQKCGVTFITNLLGVWIVKYAEEKLRRDKLWLVKITIPRVDNIETVKEELKDVPCTYYDVTKYYVLDCYCNSQAQTDKVLKVCKKYKGKAFASSNTL